MFPRIIRSEPVDIAKVKPAVKSAPVQTTGVTVPALSTQSSEPSPSKGSSSQAFKGEAG